LQKRKILQQRSSNFSILSYSMCSPASNNIIIISSVCQNIKILGVPIILGNFIIPTTKNLVRPVAISPCQRVYLPRRRSVLRSYINKFHISFKNKYLYIYIYVYIIYVPTYPTMAVLCFCMIFFHHDRELLMAAWFVY